MNIDLLAKKIYCRSFQVVMKAGNYLLPFIIPKTLKGAGSVKKLPGEIKRKHISNVLVVTDNVILNLGLMDGFLEAMDKAKVKYTVFSNVNPNPTDENVEEGLKLFKENDCQGIVAFGGGSPIDCAKGIAARNAHPRKTIADLQGLITVHKRIVPIWAVPTTSGTGSETTVAAVLTIAETRHKASINDPMITPICAVLDPELTKGLPPHITATTGMDALCHAVESYLNGTYCTELENEYAKRAVLLVYGNLYRAYLNGDDLTARQRMQLAAFYAGRSFTRGCVGNVHAVGHTLGGLYGIPHGFAMSVILPHALRQYGSRVYGKLSELADVCCLDGNTKEEKALNFIAWIEEMNEKMGIPKTIEGIKKEDIPKIIRWADRECNPLYPVPVIFGKKDYERLIDSIMAV